MMQNLKYMLVHIALVILSMANMIQAKAQVSAEKQTERTINASRGAASPLFFRADDPAIALVGPGKFSNDKETSVRGGLSNFFSKLAANKPVTVGYIGGSITQAHFGYRLQSAKYIRSLYPAANIQFLNAGVSGTGTDLAACRLNDQILIHQPDLIFIEFAVNGAYQEGLEGMIRQVIRRNPKTDICLIYTVISGQTKIYADGLVPENIRGFEKVATYYGLPSIHLGMEAAALEKANKLIWKGDAKSVTDKIVFSVDGVHPTTEGGNLYAAAIARGMNKMKERVSPADHTLPKSLFTDNWEDAKMLDPLEVARFSKGWKKISTAENALLRQFNNWFPYVMFSEKTGSSFTFRFKGTRFGFYDLGGPEVGQVAIEVDANTNNISVINRFNVFCNNRYRGQYEFIETAPGEHTVTISMSPLKADKAKILGENQQEDITSNPEKYDRTALYLGKILLKGDIIK